ncbi:MAG TPA: tetratricopeptide repeat protein, partial [Candidatus Deferrimicrobiaceae bacterium]
MTKPPSPPSDNSRVSNPIPRVDIGTHLPDVSRSKLIPPGAGRFIVSRPRLDQWFDGASWAKLILVRMPSGFGKTTVMLQWLARLRERKEAAVWLTIDPADNDPGRLLTHILVGLHEVDPSVDIRLAGSSASSLLLHLLDQIAVSRVPFTFFIDDCNHIRNPEVSEVLRQIFEQMPQGRRFVIGTRRYPEMGIWRMRARGQVADLSVGDLCFNRAATMQYLRQVQGIELNDDEVDRIHRTAEGWVAGLQLTALAIARSGKGIIKTLSGASFDIAGYLAEEVFSTQTEEVQQFLLKTSILGRFTGPLCDALTGQSNGYEMLQQLEQANLFLIPLDSEHRWFRYHNFFSQFLRNRLDRDPREKIVGLHRSAVRWFTEKCHLTEAVPYALGTGDTDMAAQLMAECAIGLVGAGQGRTVLDWVAQLPPEIVNRHPKLLYALCLTLILHHRYQEAESGLGRLIEIQDRLPGSGITQDHVNNLQSLVMLYSDRLEECHAVTTESLKNAFRWGPHAVLLNDEAFCLIALDRFDEAQEMLRRALPLHQKVENTVGAVYAMCFQGMIEATQGNLQSAIGRYRGALTYAVEHCPAYSVAGAIAGALLAEVLYEIDDVAESENLLRSYLGLTPEVGLLDVMIAGYVTKSRISLSRGQRTDAQQAIYQAEEQGYRIQASPRFRATLILEKARQLLESGDPGQAGKLLERAGDKAIWKTYHGWTLKANDPETVEIHGLRLKIRTGHAREAVPRLKSILEEAERSRRFWRALKIRVLLAEALAECDQKKPALRILRDALVFAARNGFVRTVADEGRAVASLAREFRTAAMRDDGTGSGLPVAYLDKLLAAMGQKAPTPRVVAPDAEEGRAEKLSEREIQILEIV